jgi:hypothetical protein
MKFRVRFYFPCHKQFQIWLAIIKKYPIFREIFVTTPSIAMRMSWQIVGVRE